RFRRTKSVWQRRYSPWTTENKCIDGPRSNPTCPVLGAPTQYNATRNMLQRPRRNRKSAVIRDMVQETRLHASNLIFPLFIVDGDNQKTEVASMPGIYRLS